MTLRRNALQGSRSSGAEGALSSHSWIFALDVREAVVSVSTCGQPSHTPSVDSRGLVHKLCVGALERDPLWLLVLLRLPLALGTNRVLLLLRDVSNAYALQGVSAGAVRAVGDCTGVKCPQLSFLKELVKVKVVRGKKGDAGALVGDKLSRAIS
jgi:hypothetical protein